MTKKRKNTPKKHKASKKDLKPTKAATNEPDKAEVAPDTVKGKDTGQSKGSQGDNVSGVDTGGSGLGSGGSAHGDGLLGASGDQDVQGGARRQQQLTEKGKAFDLTNKQRALNSAASKWRSTASMVERAITDSDSVAELREFRDSLEKDLCAILDCARALMPLLDGDEENLTAGRVDSIETHNLNLLSRTTERIREIQHETGSGISKTSHKSATSQKSRVSSISRVSGASKVSQVSVASSTKRSEAAAEAAALETKLRFLDAEATQKRELERVQTKMHLEMARARVQAYAGPDAHTLNPNAEVFSPSRPTPGPVVGTHQANTHKTTVPMTNKVAEVPDQYSDFNHDELVDRSIANEMYLNRLPLLKPGVFMGDPMEFPAWKGSFHTLIGKRKIPASERIHYLREYLSGRARESVEGLLRLATDDAYHRAMNLLEKRFGDPFVIASAYRDKLEAWPKISPRDGPGLQRFGDYLQHCVAMMETYSSLNILNDERQNKQMLSKLPDWVITRWARHVANFRRAQRGFPPFVEFADFVVAEGDIACDPVTSLPVAKPMPYRNNEKPERHAGAFNISTTMVSICPNCQGKGHKLEKCFKFLKLTPEERNNFVKKEHLCFGCLRSGHRSNACRSRMTCDTCSLRHPTCLHLQSLPATKTDHQRTETVPREDKANVDGGVPKVRASTGFITAGDGRSSKTTLILPVYLSHKDCPEREVMVYAMLDSQSDTTFVLDSTLKELGIKGVNTRLLLSTLSSKDEIVSSRRVKGLTVRGVGEDEPFSLPITFSRHIMPANREHIPGPETAREWSHLRNIADKLSPVLDIEIGLLIGYDCPRAQIPREVVAPENNVGPYAQRTDLGWGIVGTLSTCDVDGDAIGVSHYVLAQPVGGACRELQSQSHIVLRTSVKEVISNDTLLHNLSNLMAIDFNERELRVGGASALLSDPTADQAWSLNDTKFIKTMEEGIHKMTNGHYEMPLPLKETVTQLTNNKGYALSRLQQLKRKLMRDPKLLEEYTIFMKKMIDEGHCEIVHEEQQETNLAWYIPHHAVRHPKKPEKVRVVFDCSAQFKGESLNDHLLPGPDMTNGLVGVLCRFRKEAVAVMCDVEGMFHQFHVNKEHRNLLRFLWWTDGDLDSQPTTYRMTVHLFGAVSSPSCANFGLKTLADDYVEEVGTEVAEFFRQDFYVDDGLRSVSSVEEGIQLVKGSQQLGSKGKLHLHKFVSNSEEVLNAVSPQDRAPKEKARDLLPDGPLSERALGVHWLVKEDMLGFELALKAQPVTRRGILSVVSSVYDPLGLASPVILRGRQILQDLSREKLDWDTPLDDVMQSRWQQWQNELCQLSNFQVPRCYKPAGFGKIKKVELHHFSDASLSGYGTCSYLRLINSEEKVHCTLVIGKARVAPLKTITVPRLELTAATTAVRVSLFLDRELRYEDAEHHFWCDSRVVLGYIGNESKRYHTFVANRVQFIHDHCKTDQWHYISTNENPADLASRGSTPGKMIKDERWLQGPEMLWQSNLLLKEEPQTELPQDDPEVKCRTMAVSTGKTAKENHNLTALERFSSWGTMKRVMAWCLRFLGKCRDPDDDRSQPHLSVAELKAAELSIIRMVQSDCFAGEIKELRDVGRLKSTDNLVKLDPFVDENGILRVGGRLRQGDLSFEIKHPVLLPKHGQVSKNVISHVHERVAHQGRGMTVSALRSHGYWIVGAGRVAATLISRCVTCSKMRSETCEQQMADFPADRLESSAPFSQCGVDYFGPFLIKEGRKELKRWGIVFTCLASRAVHLDIASSLTTDSYINALRRFISLRGPVRKMRSDQGTNFVGASNELARALSEIDDEQVRNYLLENGCEFHFNVPHSSHMGGVWERLIRTTRNILAGLLSQHGTQLDDEGLRTLMAETMAIINSRPLTVDTLNDPTSLVPITPNQLLTMKTSVVLPPPGDFQKADVYSRKRWRRVQYLANVFWTRWKKEFLLQLQQRRKWSTPRPNLEVGDIVLLKDDHLPRCQWRLARIARADSGSDGLVRTVGIMLGNREVRQRAGQTIAPTYLDRPVTKLVLLLRPDRDEDSVEE